MSLVLPQHLRRAAYVYVRQSTPGQVRDHRESLARQYELAERALALGWAPEHIVTIDEDLGHSGSSAEGRDGFKRLVADVGLARVGIVLGIEVSRLARRNADWYQLLDLCALSDTLIADADGIYHPAMHNDRLVLGLKGTMSEAELHVIRQRLQGGLLHKAARGELRQGLPVGFSYDHDGRLRITADEAVRRAIAEVFALFAELGSARQVMLRFIEQNRQLPRRRCGEPRVRWAPPSYGAIHDLLTNPCYAGAYVFGRTRVERRVQDGRVCKAIRELAPEEWAVCIPEHHEGFITWERYLENRARLRANWHAPRGEAGGALREGSALLQGLLRCGRCSRMMQVSYSGRRGNCPRYACVRANQLHGSAHACQSLGGRRLEQTVAEAVFAVLQPAAIEATLRAIEEAALNHQTQVGAAELDLERVRYEAERARRQFNACEPENRLVGRTLEKEWEVRLAEVRRAEAALARVRAHLPQPLSAEEVSFLRRAGTDLRRVLEAQTTSNRERKQLLHALIEEIVVTVDRAERVAHLKIIWEGGAATEHRSPLNRSGQHYRRTDEDTMELLRRLAPHYDDRTIAAIFARQGRLTGTGKPFTVSRVRSLRQANGLASHSVIPACDDAQVVTVAGAAAALSVSTATVHRWLREGFITGEQLTPQAPWRIRLTTELRDKVAEDAPAGWLQLDQAASYLGVARQTVLHWVQSGKLAAVYVRRGKRKGLRIQVKPEEPGLFEKLQGKEEQC